MSCFRQKQHNVSFLSMRKKCRCMCCWCTERDAIVNETSSLLFFFLFSFWHPHAVLTRNLKKMPTTTTPTFPFCLLLRQVHCYFCFCCGPFSTPRLLPCLFSCDAKISIVLGGEIFTLEMPILTFLWWRKRLLFCVCGENWSLTNLQGFVLCVLLKCLFSQRRGYAYLHYMSFSNEICRGCMSSPSNMLVSVLAPCCPSLSSRFGIWLKEKKKGKIPEIAPMLKLHRDAPPHAMPSLTRHMSCLIPLLRISLSISYALMLCLLLASSHFRCRCPFLSEHFPHRRYNCHRLHV